MANYNLTNQPISASFQQLLQINDSNYLVDGTGSLIDELKVTGSISASTYYGDGSNLTGISAGGSSDTGSLLITASVVDATTTYTKGNGDIFTTTIDNVANAVSSSYAVSSSQAENADNATSASHAVFAEDSDDLILNVKNTSGADIGKGLAIHATGVTGENVNIELADASNPSNMPSIGVTRDIITNNASGVIVISGKIVGIDTSGFSAGENVYVGTSGVLTSTKPTGSNLIQNIGVVGKVDASDGELIVLGSGRTNDLPNITDGYGWFGNTDGVPTAQTTASFAKTDIDNTFSGTQAFDNISVSGTGSFGRIEAVTGSAKIIGDAFVVVNADTPTLRYAGLQVYDSGSSATASIEWDGGTDSWILVEEGGQSSFILTGPTGSKGSEVDLTNNTIPKAGAHRQLVDSIISDDGSTATIGGNINVTGNYNGFDSGSFALLGAANTFTGGTQVAQSTNGTFLSKPNYPSSGFTQKKLWDLSSQNIPIGTGTYNLYQSSFTNFAGYGRWYENGTLFNEAYDGGSFNYGSEQSFNGGGTQFYSIASGSGGLGSGNHAQFQVQDNFDGTAGINLDAQKIYIGQSSNARLQPANIRIGGSVPVLVSGSNGYVSQVMTPPAHPSEKSQTTLVGASNGGTAYNRVFQGITDYSGYGLPETEDAFAIEYFDGTGYNNGSQFYLNGKSTELGCKAAGGGTANQSLVKLQDNGDTSSTVTIKGTNVDIGTTGTTKITIGQTGNAIVVSGSLQSSVSAIGISSQTASLDFNGPSLQSLELVSGSDTRLEVQNRKEGVTINLKVRQPGTGYGNLILDNPFREPSNFHYTASQQPSATDILTFVSFEASDTAVYVANVKTLD